MPMATGGRGLETYYARAMLEIRTTLHLSQRLGVRVSQLLMVAGAAAPGAGWRRLAVPAFMVLDVAIWAVLRRSDRFGLAWRLPLDALDAAFWTLSPAPGSGDYGWAVMIAVPLAVESGVRLGWRALVVPSTLLLSTGIAAGAVGKPMHYVAVGWLVLAVLLGALFLRHCRTLDAQAQAQRDRNVAAARRRAYLAGQNQVAMGASSAVDVIEGLVPVLGRPRAGSALWQLADGWKSDLSASTAQEATYLQVALLEWERMHNRHPDLSGLVQVRVEEGQGTTLLGAAQAAQLNRELERLALRGPVLVRLADPGLARLPGQALRLDVAGRSVVLDAEGRAAAPPFDPGTMAYFYVGALALANSLPGVSGMPVPIAVAEAAMCAVAGVVSYRRIVALGERARSGVLSLAIGVGLVLTLLATTARSPVSVDGEPVLGFGLALILLWFLGGFYWRSLGRRRWWVPVAATANIVLALVVFPVPEALNVGSVVAALVYSLYPFFACHHLATALAGAGARHTRFVHTADEEAEHAAFLAGRQSVVSLVRQARADALAQLEVLRPQLDTATASLAAHRLEEVERRLGAMDRRHESSSSMTTS